MVALFPGYNPTINNAAELFSRGPLLQKQHARNLFASLSHLAIIHQYDKNNLELDFRIRGQVRPNTPGVLLCDRNVT